MNKVINELNARLDAAAVNNGVASDEEKARYNAACESVTAAMDAKADAQRSRELAMYGCTVDAIDDAFEQAFTKGMYIMGILSDVQEAMAHEQYEMARQFANKAKYLMSKHLPKDEQGRML